MDYKIMEKMIQEYRDMDSLVTELSLKISDILATAIETNQKASMLLSGGTTPIQLYERLSQCDIDWNQVDIGLVDERFVSKDSALSNEKMIRDTLIKNKAKNVRFTGMIWNENYKMNLKLANEAYKNLLNPDLLILGMGSDGHTASLFPNDMSSMISTNENQPALSNTSAPSEPKRRITLNKSFIFTSKTTYLLIQGKEKALILQKTMENDYPISQFIPMLQAIYLSQNASL